MNVEFWTWAFGICAQAGQDNLVVGADHCVLDRGRTSDFRFCADSEHYFWIFLPVD